MFIIHIRSCTKYDYTHVYTRYLHVSPLKVINLAQQHKYIEHLTRYSDTIHTGTNHSHIDSKFLTTFCLI